ncbi:MAG: gamma carbonic anhydrase family protein [Deltaproteobacteria bacterium]|nr:gamma carbonic anhydrase family protein [Deltaproteobacteria bacterium]
MTTKPFITSFGDKSPRIDPTAFVDIAARIIGSVFLAEEVSVWPMAVLRADDGFMEIHRRAAILDLALLETPAGRRVIIGEESIISHGAKVHGAIVEPRVLVGIGAAILDDAVVGSGSLIGAGSVVTPGMVIPPNSLVLGLPGKVIRQTTEQERATIAAQVNLVFNKSRKHMELERG